MLLPSLNLRIIALLAALALPVRAEVEKWTSKDGKTAELEFVRLSGEGDSASVEFRTRAGKSLTMKLADLREEDRQRALELGRFAASRPHLSPGELTLVDGTPGKKGAPRKKVSIRFIIEGTGAGTWPDVTKWKVDPVRISGKELKAQNWDMNPGGVLDSKGSRQAFSLTTKAEFENPDLSEFELKGTAVLRVANEAKEATAALKTPKQGDKSKQQVGPVPVVLERSGGEISIQEVPGSPFNINDYFFVVNGKLQDPPLRASEAGETVEVKIIYSDAFREVEVPFSCKAP